MPGDEELVASGGMGEKPADSQVVSEVGNRRGLRELWEEGRCCGRGSMRYSTEERSSCSVHELLMVLRTKSSAPQHVAVGKERKNFAAVNTASHGARQRAKGADSWEKFGAEGGGLGHHLLDVGEPRHA